MVLIQVDLAFDVTKADIVVAFCGAWLLQYTSGDRIIRSGTSCHAYVLNNLSPSTSCTVRSIKML